MDSNIIDFLRQFRIGGFTVFDAAASFLGIYILSPLLSKLFRFIGLDIPRKSWLCLVLPIAVVAHFLSGNLTPMTREFLDLNGYYLLKAVILVLSVLGIGGIKRIKKEAKP